MDKIHECWERLHNEALERYFDNPDASFAKESRSSTMFGLAIEEHIPSGTCLDIGCGILRKPHYMKVAKTVKFSGVDPIETEEKRNFVFKVGYAENLPFGDSSFDGVSFATSLDHVENPIRALAEAHRVTKRFLFIWNSIKHEDEKFDEWFGAQKPALYDDMHMWAFSHRTLISYLHRFRVNVIKKIHNHINVKQYIYVCEKR